MKLKPIVTDTYDFPTLIRNGNVYVDKTAYLHRLVSKVDGTMFFMSRPRRFGKSLTISTLEQIFKGEKKLFTGLAIAKTDYDWTKHPIMRLDMTAFDHTSGLATFKRSLAAELGGTEPIAAFRALIAKKAKAARGKGVVVLIDEYDSPISGLLGKPAELAEMRDFLQSFYRILKQDVASIRFLLMTGVSKFTKLSVFSGLNNLTDLTMDPAYAGLLGYTPDELITFFGPQIREFAKATKRTPSEVVSELLAWYDSYRFSPESDVCVCNPVSVGRALRERRFYGFWNATGNATLIIERLRKARKSPFDLDGLMVRPEQLDVCEIDRLPVEALLYQGGYLTIGRRDPSGLLALRVPNREVRQILDSGYVGSVLKDRADDFENGALRLVSDLDSAEDPCLAISRALTAVFAMIPHEWKLKSEAEAKRYFLLFMRMAGAKVCAEVESSKGRADAVLETDKAVYILEFKYGKSAKAALKQIHARDYAKPYSADKRPVVAVGVGYNARTGVVKVESAAVKSLDAKTSALKEMGGLTSRLSGEATSISVGEATSSSLQDKAVSSFEQATRTSLPRLDRRCRVAEEVTRGSGEATTSSLQDSGGSILIHKSVRSNR